MARVRWYEPYGYREEQEFDGLRNSIDDAIRGNNEIDEMQWEAFYSVQYDSERNAAVFYDHNGDERGVINMKDTYPSLIDDAWYDKETNELYLKFDDDHTVSIDMSDVIDINEFGDGLIVDENGIVNIKVHEGDGNILSVSEDGVYVNGDADNISYTNSSETGVKTVKEMLDALRQKLSEHPHSISDIEDVVADPNGIVLEKDKAQGIVTLEAGKF